MKTKSDRRKDVEKGPGIDVASLTEQKVEKDISLGQYDLSHVMSPVLDSRGRMAPSYSIDPWEVGVSPTSQTSQSTSATGTKRTNAVVDRTPCDDSSIASNLAPGSFDGEIDGYDPDDDDDDEFKISDLDVPEIGPSECHAQGRKRTSRPANRFLVPSDIHPNMEHREEDIAQLRLLAGKLSADWKGQDFMAPALAR